MFLMSEMGVAEEAPLCRCHGEPMLVTGRRRRCVVKSRESHRRWMKTEAGRESRRRYARSAKGRAAQVRYDQSEGGRARNRRYVESERGRETRHRNEVDRYARKDWKTRHQDQLRARRLNALRRRKERDGSLS